MPQVTYQGRDATGNLIEGTIEADGRGHAAALLQQQGITPVSVKLPSKKPSKNKTSKAKSNDEPVSETKTSANGEIRLSFLEKVSLDELILFSRQMYSLTKAGVPVTRAMRGLGSSVKNPLLKDTVLELAGDLDKGRELSTALSKHGKIFNDLYISIIHVGENTGRLDEAFLQMARYLELERDTVKNLKQATRYPTFVLVAISIAIVIINIFVIPAFKSVFQSFGGDIPWQTQALMSFSDFMVDWWGFLLAILVGSYVAFKRWTNTEAGLVKWDSIKLKFPVVGSVFYRVTLARFSRTFSIVLRSGVPIEQGLIIVSRAVGNKYLGEKIAGMRQSIERGESFTQAAARTQMFSPLVMQMLAVGEETGQVDQMLEEAAIFYEEEVDYELKNMTSAIEPILITIIGALVLVLALGIFLPLWELSTSING